jgi:hypothetical protein
MLASPLRHITQAATLLVHSRLDNRRIGVHHAFDRRLRIRRQQRLDRDDADERFSIDHRKVDGGLEGRPDDRIAHLTGGLPPSRGWHPRGRVLDGDLK